MRSMIGEHVDLEDIVDILNKGWKKERHVQRVSGFINSNDSLDEYHLLIAYNLLSSEPT